MLMIFDFFGDFGNFRNFTFFRKNQYFGGKFSDIFNFLNDFFMDFNFF